MGNNLVAYDLHSYYIYAFDTETGKVSWSYEMPGDESSSIIDGFTHNDTVIMAIKSNGMEALDATSGSRIWNLSLQNNLSYTHVPLLSQDLVFFAIGYGVDYG